MKKAEKMELIVAVKGEIIESNVSEFCQMIGARIEQINQDLKTDEDFGQAKADVTTLSEVEKTITNGKMDALGQLDAVNAILKELDATFDQARQTRLTLSKTIKKREAEIKGEIVSQALQSLSYHITKEDEDIIKEAIKGKRTVQTIRSAAEEAARRLQARYEVAKKIIDNAVEQHGPTIAFGRDQLVRMSKAELELEIQRRFERKAAEVEQERLKKEAEATKDEIAKIKAESVNKNTEPVPPPKIGSIPVGKAASENQEFSNYIAIVRESLSPLREARRALTHKANVARATAFANSINNAWQELTKGAHQ